MALERSVDEILGYLAAWAAGYDNHLKWNEVAKLKGDLMHVPHRWYGVDVAEVERRCLELGMRGQDVTEICDLIRRRQAGKRLMPERSYRDFRFASEPEIQPPSGEQWSSRQW